MNTSLLKAKISAKSESKQSPVSPTDYVPKRFGLNRDYPPTIGSLHCEEFIKIVLEYLVPSTGKLYHHRMKMAGLSSISSVSGIVEQLLKKHAAYLNNSKVLPRQLEGNKSDSGVNIIRTCSETD